MTRRRYLTIVAVVAAVNVALLFACGFGAIGGGVAPGSAAGTVQTVSRTAIDVLLMPAIWLFTPTEDTSVIAGGSVIIANSVVWGIIVATFWALIRKRKHAAF